MRRHPARFAVLPGHIVGDVERLVAETDRYHVVEKRAGTASDTAIERDPHG